MMNQSRRIFIKGAACTSALALGSVASLTHLAIASEKQQSHTEVVTLINHTASAVAIETTSQIHTIIKPQEQLSVEIDSITAKEKGDRSHANQKHLIIDDVLIGHLSIKSDHDAFKGIFPTSTFAKLAA